MAVPRKLKLYYGMTRQHPRVWLLTGSHLMGDAACLNIVGKSSGGSASAAMLVPDPSGIASALEINPNARWRTSSSLVIGGWSKILGKRIWVGQYQKLKANYIYLKHGVEPSEMLVKLLYIFSMHTNKGEVPAAHLDVEKPATLVERD